MLEEMTQTYEVALEVINSEFCNPMNASSGWYVEVKGTREQVTSQEALNLARSEADKNGYDPLGRGIDGGCVVHGAGIYTKVFWFYTKKEAVNAPTA